MRQAHPRNEKRRRRAIGPALVMMAIGSVAFLSLGGTGFGRNASAGRTDGRDWLAAAPVSSGFPAAPMPAAPGPSLTPIVETRSGPAAEARPAVDVPDVDPIVAIGPGPGSKAVFLGDSYTSGWNRAGFGSRGWPAIVAADRGWRAVNLAVAGTGFMNPGWTSRPLGSLVDATVRQKPDIVFVASGHNDSRWSAATTSGAASAALGRLRAALPNALIVVVAPIWQDGSPPTRCLVLRDALRRTAHAVRAVFIDPLAERWFTGVSHRFIGSDGFHPTNAGHRFMADRILADLRNL